MRVLVALQPRAYRDTLVHSIKRARPRVAVHFLDPDLLDYEAKYLEPQVVICDRITPTVREFATCWVEIRHCDVLQVTVSIRGRTKIIPDIRLDELISVVDQAEVLERTG